MAFRFIGLMLIVGAIVTAFEAHGQPDGAWGYALSALVGAGGVYVALFYKGT
jgi:hypothetical protein